MVPSVGFEPTVGQLLRLVDKPFSYEGMVPTARLELALRGISNRFLCHWDTWAL